MKNIDIIQIGLRGSVDLNLKLEQMAKEKGISKNALMLVLIDIGLSVYGGLSQTHQER